MSAPDRRIAEFYRINNFVKPPHVFAFVKPTDVIFQIVKLIAVKIARVFELLHDGEPNRLTAHIHRDKCGRKNRAVFVTVDLFKNFAENRSVYQRSVIFADDLCFDGRKIVFVQEFKKIFERC